MKNIITICLLFFFTSVISQVIYTDVNPDIVLLSSSDDSYAVDFNSDLNLDVVIFETQMDTTISGVPWTFTGAALSTLGINEVAGNVMILGGENILLLDTISVAQNIDSALTYLNTTSISSVFPGAAIRVLSSGTFAATIGDFQPNVDGYIGVKFDISGSYHYGWIRVNPSTDGTSCTVLDYAYESSPNIGIIAGDYGGAGLIGIQENISNVIIRTFNNNIQVKINSELNDAQLTITNISGQQVLSKVLNSDNEIISMDGLAAGIYLATIFSDECKITKRVYIR